MTMAYQIHHFDAPCGVTFRLVLGRSTYSIDARDKHGKRIAWTGRRWGASLTDALSMAAYTGETERAKSAIWYLFARLDYYVFCPGIIDLWRAATYRGETERAKYERLAPYRAAMQRARALPYGQRLDGLAEAEKIKERLLSAA